MVFHIQDLKGNHSYGAEKRGVYDKLLMVLL